MLWLCVADIEKSHQQDKEKDQKKRCMVSTTFKRSVRIECQICFSLHLSSFPSLLAHPIFTFSSFLNFGPVAK